MGGDKLRPKSGRYVGGFLQLFDWNAKSRKKLFPSKSDLPEQPQQGKKYEGNSPMTRMHLGEDDDFVGGLSTRGGSEYSYASSITDDDGYNRSKAPGVVARLMGLDSLPTSNAVEPNPSLYLDTLSLQDASFRDQNPDFYQDHQIMYSGQLFEKVEFSSKVAMDSRHKKILSRPIEKFQSEILPPKSAKTIPITHHKLLSPIKSRIYVPSQDAAHIMAAAAKIIEPGPQTTPRAKISSAGSSSVTFKVREMREKLEAARRSVKVSEPSQRQVESHAAKCLREQPMNKSWNGTVEAASFKISPSRDDSGSAVKSKGKSISLAIQAKVNVQKREGLTMSSSRSLAPEEQDDTKLTQSFRIQPSSSNRKSLNQSTSSVLRINNQKQNCPSYRDKPVSKTSSAATARKKSVNENASSGRHKGLARDGETSRTSSRKSSLHARDGDKGTPDSGARNIPRKKRSIDGSPNLNKNQVTDNMFASEPENPSQSGMVADRHVTWIEESRRKGMDVVSFSFTAPMTRSLPVSGPLRQLGDRCSDLFNDDRHKTLTNSDISKLSSPRFNGLRGDALSVVLEQKLKELSSNLGSPHSFVKTDTSSDSAHRAVFSPGSVESAIGKTQEKIAPHEVQSIRKIFNFQAGEAVGDYSNNTETKQLSSPVSILEPSLLTGSCYSSETLVSSITEERKPCSSVSAQEVVGLSSLQKFHPVEIDMDTLDSASSTSSRLTTAKDIMKTTTWELGYVHNILCNVELMFRYYMTGRTDEILNPNLFDQMERGRGKTPMQDNKLKLERKVLFDCVGECLDLKCTWFVGGGFQMWTKGIATLNRKKRLAEEVYKDIQGCKSLRKSMVDELVDKDMSSKYGQWLDFEVDEFMLGVEIEGQILDSLVVELVADLVPSRLRYLQ